MSLDHSADNKCYPVEGLDFQGKGFIKIAGKTLSFAGVLPGDTIEINFDESKSPSVVGIAQPSRDRIKSDCRFYGPCGGCDLLELSEKARIREKDAVLKRVFSAPTPTTPIHFHSFSASSSTIRYLPRLRLHQSRDASHREAGYLCPTSFIGKLPGGIVPVTGCALLTKPLAQRLVAARHALANLPIRVDGFYLISAAVGPDKVAGHIVLAKKSSFKRSTEFLEKLVRESNLSGLSVADASGKIVGVMGSVQVDGLVAPGVEGGPFTSEPAIFSQGNIYQNKKLVETVVKLCAVEPGHRVVEGFAGAGNFSIPLGKHGAVVEGFESNPGAVRLAIRNIHKAGLDDTVKLVEADAQKALRKTPPHPDLLLLDPPRSGVSDIFGIVQKILPKKIVYVACDMETLARDSRQLIDAGYHPTEAAGMDLYPRTHHIEAVAVFLPRPTPTDIQNPPTE